jgi:hypothetical protein
VQFVERHLELVDRAAHQGQDQLGRSGVEQPGQTGAPAVVPQRGDLLMEQVEQFRRVPRRPFGNGVHRLARHQHVAHQEQDDPRRGNRLAHIIGRQMLPQELRELQPLEIVIHQRQRADLIAPQAHAALVRGCADRQCGIRISSPRAPPSLRRTIHVTPPCSVHPFPSRRASRAARAKEFARQDAEASEKNAKKS